MIRRKEQEVLLRSVSTSRSVLRCASVAFKVPRIEATSTSTTTTDAIYLYLASFLVAGLTVVVVVAVVTDGAFGVV